MSTRTWQLGFFITLLILGSVLSYLVLLPYLASLFFAVVLAILFYSVYEYILKLCRGYAAIASFITVILIVLLVLLPLVFLSLLVFQESTALYRDIASGGDAVSIVETLVTKTETFINTHTSLTLDIRSYVDVEMYRNELIRWIAQNSGAFIGGVIDGIFYSVIFILALFFLLKDGHKLLAKLIEVSPLKDDYDRSILRKVTLAVNSVVRGRLIVGLLQGILAGAGFWFFGVPSPAILGAITAVVSLLPAIGTGIVILPVALFLFLSGSTLPAIGLAVWGVIIVGVVDDIIGPKLIERGVRIHPFLILIFVLGGLTFFGPIGFIAGPVLLSIMFALLEIYPLMIERHADE